MQYEVVDVAVVKPHAIVQYKKSTYPRKYNEKSLSNLKQNNKCKLISRLRRVKEVSDIKAYAEVFKTTYKSETQKEYSGIVSSTVAKKLLKITSTFSKSILSRYRNSDSVRNRTVTLCTLTLTESQKHTDQEFNKILRRFLDHIKKVDSYLINPTTKMKTNIKAPRVRQFFWRAEVQGNGNIHYHILFDAFVNKDTLKRVWNGYLQKMGYPPAYNSARIESLRKVKDVVAYVCKYLTKADTHDKKTGKPKRPIIGKMWGCSKDLLKLDYPKFYDSDTVHLNELINRMQKIDLDDSIKDWVKCWKGNTAKLLKQCSVNLQWFVKVHYQRVFDFLYREIDDLKTILTPEPRKVRWFQTSIEYPI
ncbi:rolling circle replication-associated protein [Elizabethkingia miricola]